MDVKPGLEEFGRLAKRGNLIPIYVELPADLLTPVAAFAKVSRRSSYAYLLESVEGEERYARYSFIGLSPRMVVSSRGRALFVQKAGRQRVDRFPISGDPIWELQQLMKAFRYVERPELPRFAGGLVGYLGYDVVRFFERLPDAHQDTVGVPDMVMMLSDRLIVFDHLKHKILLISNVSLDRPARVAYQRAKAELLRVAEELRRPAALERIHRTRAPSATVRSNTSRPQFLKAVRAGKRHVQIGDVVQVVLSQRFERRVSADPLTIYRALRAVNPSPYMYYLKLGDFALIGSSPELFVRVERGLVDTRPIAGTRRRGQEAQEDAQLAQELLNDTKERAEHTMLVDLGRNDLGRVCEYGTVKVTELMAIEKYSHVMHIVSNVTGRLAKGKTIYDVIRACFPAGTVAGAPKIRAMEIIDELEQAKRGPYAGCIGYISFSGNLDTCITIRTILLKHRIASVQAGAGIVADSVPEREYDETVNKAQGMLTAIEAAERGLEMVPGTIFMGSR